MQLSDHLNQLSAHFSPLIWNITLGVISILIGLVVRLILHGVLSFYTRHFNHLVFKSVIKNLKGSANFFVPLFFLNLTIPFMILTKIEEHQFDKAVEIGLIISFAIVLIGIVKVFEEVLYDKYDLKKADNLKERKIRTQLQFVRQIIVVVIVMLTAAAILLSFENLRKIGAGLLTGVGIGGIIIGFAAQSSLSNLLAGFQIAFTQPLRIDDVVIVEGEYGNVEEITLTYVVVRIWDQRRLVLPIRYFIEKPFQNWTRTTSEILGTAFFYLDFSIPIDELRKEFNRLIDLTPLWDKRVKVLQVTDMKERSVEVRTLASARNSSDAFDLRCYIRENMMLFIQKNYPESFPKNRSEVLNSKNPVAETQPLN
ncbi:MAG TPA: mechanosensitive ion channel domain-containing protein [Cyclobacteriaceae bacterium]